MSTAATAFAQSFFHGSRAALRPGDRVIVGYPSNYTADAQLSWVYCAATLDAALWGAELGSGLIYQSQKMTVAAIAMADMKV